MRLKSATFIAGVAFFGVPVSLAIVSIFVQDFQVSLILLQVMGTIGVIFLAYDNFKTLRFRRLKHSGICYDAEIYHLHRHRRTNFTFVRIGPYSSSYVECRYFDEYGQEHHAKSHYFLWGSYDYHELAAKVYVDRDDPGKYVVEVSKKR